MTTSRSLLLLVLLLPLGCRGIEPLPAPAEPAGVDVARVALGQALFFDPRLSGTGDVACATCHRPDHGGAEPRATSVGAGGRTGSRNAPSVFNASLKVAQFWDGRAASLEAQARGPLFAPHEMAADEGALLAWIRDDEAYRQAFTLAFPEETGPIEVSHLTRALAAYERRLAWPGRVDRFMAGDTDALTPEERAGYDDFSANCAFCHDGAAVGGQRFERLGDQVEWPASRSADLGRMEVTGDTGDRLVFVVPSLRHVGRTAPYFHDGSVATLEEAVRLMAHHQLGETWDDARIAHVVAFLRALDGDIPPALLRDPHAE
ncbi:MAG: cytochrome-c peroxidase [Sandaracinaceae bacterium]